MPKKLAKSIGFSILIIVGLIIFPAFAQANQHCQTGGGTGTVTFPNPLRYCSIVEIVDGIVNILFMLALAIAPLLVLVGAFYIMTAGGDPKRADTGKKFILYAAIGLAVVLLAKGIVGAVKLALGVS